MHKSISIPNKQAEWLNKRHISLSKFVQDKICEEMENHLREPTSIKLEEKQLEWLNKKVKLTHFASLVHGIRYCVQHVMEESGGE